MYLSTMNTLQELGASVANRRLKLGLKQRDLAKFAGVPVATLNRFERGNLGEFGSRKLLSLLAVLDLELKFSEKGFSGSLDELREERARA